MNSALCIYQFLMGFNHDEDILIRAAKTRSRPLWKEIDLKPLIDKIRHAKVVMLGEATHGTHDFYEWRRLISEWLIVKHGFRFIAVEGDWPPCWELNRYIHSKNGGSARSVLQHFNRWPTWMWANTEIIRLAEWMKSHNRVVSDAKKIGFLGLDVYSLFESIDAVLSQLEEINPFLARRARILYECFDPFKRDEKAYARSLLNFPEGCRGEVIKNLQELLALRLDESKKESHNILLNAQQNARIIANAENYYRTMIYGDEDSWNIRDRHMLETLNWLLSHYGSDSKGIVWAHNTHIGDYRATDMASQGQINIGGLARQEWGEDQVALIGFGTYQGEVIASHAWNGPIEKLPVPPGKPGSYEAILHKVAQLLRNRAFFMDLRGKGTRQGPLSQMRGHRAIGVVYQPHYEGLGNYVPTSLAHRYDAFIFIDETSPITPLVQGFDREEIPETWPQGL
ncbi:MAG: erythromycin esterase family protein [Bdellovibrionia bacterium]